MYWRFVLYLIATLVILYFCEYLINACLNNIVCVTVFIADSFLLLLLFLQLNCNTEVYYSLPFFVLRFWTEAFFSRRLRFTLDKWILKNATIYFSDSHFYFLFLSFSLSARLFLHFYFICQERRDALSFLCVTHLLQSYAVPSPCLK